MAKSDGLGIGAEQGLARWRRRLLAGALGLIAAVVVLAGWHVPAAWAQGELFVGNADVNTITVYSRTASGNTAPLRTLSGGSTGLSTPAGVALDLTNNELFVANEVGDSITVYSRTASGNTAPLRTLSGAATGLDGSIAVALDLTNDELFVVNAFGGGAGTITVYSRTASGNTAPLRTLGGAATGLSEPLGVALDLTNNELFVTNGIGSTITVYSRTASGNTAPLRTLSGGSTELNLPVGVALDLTNNELFVGNAGNKITVYSRTASGNTAPLRTLSGAATGLNNSRGVALDLTNNELFVANASPGNTITVYSRTASGNTAPLRTLSGAATGLSNPIGIALGPGTGPALATTPTPASGTVGVTALNDQATLSGGSSPTGFITFALFSPADPTCSGGAFFSQTVPVSGNGTVSTSGGPVADAAGTWHWTASYSGDANNSPAGSTCADEPVFVSASAAPIPTLSEWGMIMMATVLAWFAMRRMRRAP